MKHNYTDNNNLQGALGQLLHALEGGSITKAEADRIIRSNPDNERELLDLLATWKELEKVEVPPIRPQMDTAFYKMLNDEQSLSQSGNSSSWKASLSSLIKKVIDPKVLAFLAALFIGFIVGKYGFYSKGDLNLENSENASNSTIQFANLQEQNTFDRLEKINSVESIGKLDETVLEALNKTLLYDTNVNVRLSALETMMAFAEHPKVREHLIRSIPYQDSPIVQMELAELMITLEEKRSSANWKELLESGMVDSDVKIQLQKKLENIL